MACLALRNLAGIALLAVLAAQPSLAQVETSIVRDGSLGPDASRQPEVTHEDPRIGNSSDIHITEELGERRGKNLFHSFASFDLGHDDTALFSAQQETSAVLARVTNGSPSFIEGRIRVLIDGADLFFLNPAGIVFGPNVRLDVPGVFHASTATSWLFDDGDAFEANAFAPLPALVGADPASFGFLGGAASVIQVRGTAEPVSQRPLRNDGGLDLSGGVVELVEGGQIFVGSAPEDGRSDVTIHAAERFSMSGTNLTKGAVISTTPFGDVPGGGIRIVAPLIELSEGAEINTSAGGAGDAGDIALDADELHLRGASRILTSNQGSGRSGGISIEAQAIELSGGSSIESLTTSISSAAGGDILIVSSGDLSIGCFEDCRSEPDPPSIVVETQGSGLGGSARIQGRIVVVDGIFLATNTTGSGAGGNLVIEASEEVVLRGSSIDGVDAALATLTFADGDAGALEVQAPVIRMQNGAAVFTSVDVSDLFPNATGTAGDVSLKAGSLIELSGRSSSGKGSILDTATRTAQDAGDILLEAPRILLDESEIRSETSGAGGGGSISVHASEELLVSRSSLVASTFGAGPGGDVSLSAGARLSLTEARAESNSSLGSGAAGSVRIAAPDVALLGGSRVEAATHDAGRGGSVRLDFERLQLREGARVAATSLAPTAAGAAGRVEVGLADGAHSPREIRLSDAAIETSAASVDGGDISLRASELVLLAEGSGIRSNVAGAQGGRIEIAAPELVLLRGNSTIAAQARAPDGSGGSIRIRSDAVLVSRGSEISASALGGPEFQGEVVINAPEVELEGQVAPPAVEFLDASSLLLAQCSSRRSGERAGSFQLAHRPGLPHSGSGPLLAFEALVAPGALASARSGLPPVAAGPGAAEAQDSEHAASARRLRRGEAAGAADDFSALAAASRGSQRGDALRGAAQAWQLQGAYAESLEPLREALATARADGDAAREAAALGQLGNAYVALRVPARAAETLEASVAAARRSADRALLATALNNLGNQRAIAGDLDAARDAYAESAAEAQAIDAALAAAQALANAAHVALEQGALEAAARLLIRSKLRAHAVEGGAEAVALRVHLADSYARLASLDPGYRREGFRMAHRSLLEASGEAQAAGSPRQQSLVYGQLGALYAQEEGREAEALYLTQRALARAEQVQAMQLMARWYSQAGRIQWTQGRRDAAVASLQRAVEILAQTRPEAQARYGGVEASFQRAVAPSYLALVDMLLQQSATEASAAGVQAKLRAARATVEQFRAAELRDYFQDECIAALEAQTTPVEQISANAAVVYPILLPDRLELLVSRPSGLARHVVAVQADALAETVQRFRKDLMLRPLHRYLRASRQLHDWLLAPYVDALAAEGVDTLVVVPDGVLRMVPWSALHDGSRFLIERFAVAVTPSLDVIAPKPLVPADTRVLVAGVSEAVQNQPALPNVRSEVAAIQSLYGGQLLLDADFQIERLAEELRERPPGVVHIASHAEFTGDPETSYVLTHDARLSMEELSRLVASGRFGEEPLELLMLSACNTAAGDARAALGLAGMAVRAGARSAVGSLWAVSDEAAPSLIAHFYEEMGRPEVSKAQAMARAQRALLREPRFRHPFYWAGFLVINNWL